MNIHCTLTSYGIANAVQGISLNVYYREVLPSGFNPMNLVELDLSRSKIKQLWEVKTPVQKLKLLNLSYCKNLIRIPDLSDIPSAESIHLKFYSSLIEIHSSRGCPKLKQLDLSSCRNLIRIPDLSDIPSAESIDLKLCSSLREIHSSKEWLKSLHSLNLWKCKDLSRLPSNIHIEGSEFNLDECIDLTKFPHISGNIKRLEMRGSGVEEVPSTIQSLSKLESLDMDRCESLKHISKSICKLKSLDRLDLMRCCKLESFPDIMEEMELKYLNLRRTAIKELPPSIGNLNRLEELNLSKTAIKELPPSIGNLNQLEGLDLSETAVKELPPSIGNLNQLKELDFCGCKNLERLPKSIKKLSKLYSLKLSDCGMLRSLPELPSSLRHLEAINCKQLIQSLPDSSLYFNFINCLKMNQEAVSNLLIFFRDCIIRKMQRMGTEKIISLFKVSHEVTSHLPPSHYILEDEDEVKGSIFLPGSEIPEWFSYKNNGSSINIPGLRNDCGRSSYIMGFAVCLVFGFDFDIGFFESVDVRYDFHIETRDVHLLRAYQLPGAYSEAAALKADPKSETVPCEQFEAAFKVLAQYEMTLSKLGIIRVNADDTAGAAQMVASSGERDSGAVASP
ncbi:hypothetical protein EZV62_026293 [Acer yangbiense]|uniref:Uncharacterized protein n=1 Tax=Acer yangbiense TaxID=1000413 RepID=A0A5C7GR86_9ROSI|nr:hypothetical protein EZV62_026293 [Acer yangbiense]